MVSRTPTQTAALIVADLRVNRGRRILHGMTWRTRRLWNRLLAGGSLEQQRAIYSVGFGPNGERVLAVVRESMAEFGFRAIFGGASGPTARALHIEAGDIDALCRCLLTRCPDRTLYVRVRRQWKLELSHDVIKRLVLHNGSFDVLVAENLVDADRLHVQCSRIEVGLWTARTGPYGNTYLESDRSIAIAGRIRKHTFSELADARHDFDTDTPTPDQPRFPIDVVYTWVDDADEEWQEQKARYRQRSAGRLAARVLKDERFRNRDELKYSLRSLDLFAPWVRRVHIVTASQCPPWLDVDHPRLNLVDHHDIYADDSWLPTFNSSGIETQLHHIPGLARYFLYFNDDFFLGQLCDPGDFFYSNGLLKFFPTDQRAYERDIDRKSEEYVQADKNAIELLREALPSVGRTIMSHVPYPSDCALLDEMEHKWPDQFSACASARFRSSEDIRPIAFMQYHYGFGTGRAVPASMSHRYLALWKPTILEQLQLLQRRRSRKTFCINDVGLQEERTALVNDAVVTFLEGYYPTPSTFERQP